jgi:hypothetical protein
MASKFLLRLSDELRARIDSQVSVRKVDFPKFSINDFICEVLDGGMTCNELYAASRRRELAAIGKAEKPTGMRKIPGRAKAAIMPAGLPRSEQMRWRREHP